MIRSLAITAASFFFLFGLSAAAAQTACLRPLADPADRDPAKFQYLADLNPTAPAQGVVRFQTIGSGQGPANIDFYFVTFTPPPNSTPASFFKSLRLNFPSLAAGKWGQYAFGPYSDGDNLAADNLAKWNSDHPIRLADVVQS